VRRLAVSLLLVSLLTSCARAGVDTSDVADLQAVTVDQFQARLQGLDRPAVVNVWASWCIPCRSEAPLLSSAFEAHGDLVEFIGVDVQDNQPDAKSFIAEHGLDFEHFFDRDRAIPNHYAGIGTPITFFFDRGGELVSTHNGIIDERGLALGIDELLRRDS
jgi:cytochrome c biogenesis protein CcmG, thiol:disulfide interchange protein DsbE